MLAHRLTEDESRPIETMNLMSETSMMANRTVRVGIDDAPPAPMQLGNPDAGDFRGYEVDLLEEIGRRVGFRLSFRRALWSVIIRELMAGDVDLVCSAATVTAEREREVDFCVPHLRLALAVVKRDGIAGDTEQRLLSKWLGDDQAEESR
jgi:glutamine transport system substrate-binding protein